MTHGNTDGTSDIGDYVNSILDVSLGLEHTTVEFEARTFQKMLIEFLK